MKLNDTLGSETGATFYAHETYEADLEFAVGDKAQEELKYIIEQEILRKLLDKYRRQAVEYIFCKYVLG